MSISAEENLEKILENAPEFLTASQIVDLGLFSSKMSFYKARSRGETPPALQISKQKLRFPKKNLISWLKAKQTHLA